ncbi:cation transporter [Chthonobacter rhizosphaerae]|uniref:cation transporter n=1 Tax=Chthonobacter rhizosphaerae TaxID=2735553 RepID=UPI0015EEBD8A|nr:cation transporter [Chthonobacter rhizosphaerae]
MDDDDDFLHAPDAPLHKDPAYRRVLVQAALLNGSMFVAEGIVGLWIGSAALVADAVDFLEDTGIYMLGVVAIGWSLLNRARAGFVMGLAMVAVGLVALGQVFVRLWYGGVPSAVGISLTAAVALSVNVFVAVRLIPYRTGDSSMRSIWLSTRNDAVLNLLTIVAGVLVASRMAAWPDIVAGLVIAGVNLWAAREILSSARAEMTARPTARGHSSE